MNIHEGKGYHIYFNLHANSVDLDTTPDAMEASKKQQSKQLELLSWQLLSWQLKLLITCLASTAAVYSLPNVRSVIDTSSNMMKKSLALSIRSRRIIKLTCCLCVIN